MAPNRDNSNGLVGGIRNIVRRWWPLVAISAIGFAATPWLLGPRCPDTITIATGSPDGAYYAFAQEYKKVLAEKGITLNIQTTSGSIENQKLLSDTGSDVSIAIVQGGTGGNDADLQSLASLYPEPVWLFFRSQIQVRRLTDLKGKVIAIGDPESGTRAIARKLLADNGIVGNNEGTEMVDGSPSAAARNLREGRVDAAFFVMSPSSPLIQELLADPQIQILSFDRSSAYRQKYAYLSAVTLPQGIVDLDSDIPAKDIALVAPTANLVVREDFHHALIPLMLEAVERTHKKNGLLVKQTEFPSPRFTEYELNSHAERYFQSGPSFLYRYLPFWVAAWLDRIKLILLPLCTLLIPLLKLAPPIYRWRIRSKIYRWYRVLHEVDQHLAENELVSRTQPLQRSMQQELIEKLSRVEQELMAVSVPLSYMEEFYNLRFHIDFVKQQLTEKAAMPHSARMAA